MTVRGCLSRRERCLDKHPRTAFLASYRGAGVVWVPRLLGVAAAVLGLGASMRWVHWLRFWGARGGCVVGMGCAGVGWGGGSAPMWHWVRLTHRTPHWVHAMHPMPHWGASRRRGRSRGRGRVVREGLFEGIQVREGGPHARGAGREGNPEGIRVNEGSPHVRRRSGRRRRQVWPAPKERSGPQPGSQTVRTGSSSAARTAGCRRCGSSPLRRGCRCGRPRRTRPLSRLPSWPSRGPSGASRRRLAS